jgi:hypothetical protein
MADIRDRCEAGRDLVHELQLIVADNETWMAVFECPLCGAFWAQEHPFAEYHGGGQPCFYRIDSSDPVAWLHNAVPTTPAIRAADEDKKFFDLIGHEVGPEPCSQPDCFRRDVALSVL